jgi:DNA invertase Pin-like site-specific DNA recombinase
MNSLNQFQCFAKHNKNKIISNNKAVIYTRVSDIKQQDNTSLESQKKYCTEYADNKSFEICGYYGGTYASAKTDDRKAFQEMLFDVKKKKISHIIVYSIDRFSRSGASAISTVEQLHRKGINVISVTQPVDIESSTGTFFQNINLLFSKYDNDQRREKTITGMRQRLLNGYWMGTAPLGYKNARNEQNIPIIQLSDDAKLIRKAFLWKANENISNVEIVERLKRNGLKIYKQHLTKILKNPVYCGLISSSLLEGEIVDGKHPAIVSKDVFLKVNGIQSKNPKGQHNKANENLPLKGFAKCSSCESSLTGFIVKKKGIYYYKCKTIGCSCNRNTNVLHQQFEELLNKYQLDEKLIAPLKTQMKYTFDYHNQSNKDNTATLKYNLKTITQKIDKIQERFVIGEIDGELYQKFNNKFRTEKEGIEEEINKTGLESSNLDSYINNSLKLFCNLNNVWGSSSYLEKQKLQNILFPEGITYDRKNDRVQTLKTNSIMELVRCLSVSFNKP